MNILEFGLWVVLYNVEIDFKYVELVDEVFVFVEGLFSWEQVGIFSF